MEEIIMEGKFEEDGDSDWDTDATDETDTTDATDDLQEIGTKKEFAGPPPEAFLLATFWTPIFLLGFAYKYFQWLTYINHSFLHGGNVNSTTPSSLFQSYSGGILSLQTESLLFRSFTIIAAHFEWTRLQKLFRFRRRLSNNLIIGEDNLLHFKRPMGVDWVYTAFKFYLASVSSTLLFRCYEEMEGLEEEGREELLFGGKMADLTLYTVLDAFLVWVYIRGLEVILRFLKIRSLLISANDDHLNNPNEDLWRTWDLALYGILSIALVTTIHASLFNYNYFPAAGVLIIQEPEVIWRECYLFFGLIFMFILYTNQ